MNTIPRIAIVGRPNVGKSTLFNCLLKKRVAIVERFSGVTRDRISSLMNIGERMVELVDTGGMGIPDVATIADKVQAQIETAVEEADLLLFVVDVTEGLTPLDEEVSQFLRKSEKSYILVANKADDKKHVQNASAFFKLGMGEPFAMSAKNNLGRRELIALVEERLGEVAPPSDVERPDIRFAVVGKRNVGKSTLVNALAGSERVIVSDLPGTTRDAVDVPIKQGAKFMVAVDTAGIRKKGRLDDSVEFFSRVRTEQAIRTADVVLFLLDCMADISRVDKKLASYIAEHGKPCVIVVNKWDLAGETSVETFGDYIRKLLPNLWFAPIVFISALTGAKVEAPVHIAAQLKEQAAYRVGTGMLNRLITEAIAKRRPGGRKGPQPKIYYATQAKASPPTIVLFVNRPSYFTKRYLRYIENFLRDRLPFSEIPLVVRLKASGEEETKRRKK